MIELKGEHVVDLSQTIEKDIPGPVGFPNPQLNFFREISKGDVINVESIEMGLHCCTHIDAPYHFINDGLTIEKVVPECILGTAVIVDLRHLKGSVPIEAEEVQKRRRPARQSKKVTRFC